MGRDRRPARAGRARLRFAAVAGLALLLAACGGASGERSTPTPTARDEPATATFPLAGDPGAVVEQAVQACREKDAGLLRSLIAGPVADADIEGDRAAVEVRLEIHRPAEIETINRMWQLEIDATGAWRFSELPDCY